MQVMEAKGERPSFFLWEKCTERPSEMEGVPHHHGEEMLDGKWGCLRERHMAAHIGCRT